MAWLERNQILVLGLLTLALLAGLVVRELTRSDPPDLVLQQMPTSVADSVVVHVAGAVAAPGVYELPQGSRVQDAILAAGGAVPGAGTDALNLARRLRDGEKIDLSGPTTGAAAVATLAPGQKLELNSATQQELDQLPGIGEAYSRRIVDSRAVDGPYQLVDDLVTRRVIPAATLDQVRDRLIVLP